MIALDRFLKAKREELSSLKRKRKELKKNIESNESLYKITSISEEIEKLESEIHRFRKAVMNPRKVGNLVINYKIYEQYMKKLNRIGLYTKVTLKEDRLILQYGTHQKDLFGTVELYDLSTTFEDFLNDIEKADIKL